MTTKRTTVITRRCIGSTTFGIEAHDAPVKDFPVQPSRRDGLGTMCREHWTAYTRALRQARRGVAADAVVTAVEKPVRVRRPRATPEVKEDAAA